MRLEFDDGTNTITPSFSLDNGTTFTGFGPFTGPIFSSASQAQASFFDSLNYISTASSTKIVLPDDDFFYYFPPFRAD